MLAFVLAITCHNIAYASVVLVDDSRRVTSNGSVSSVTTLETWSVEERSPGNFGNFDFTVSESRNAGSNASSSSASLQSSITGNVFSATGISSASAGLSEARGNSSVNGNGLSEFAVTFQVLERMSFSLDASLTFDQLLGSSRGAATITLFSGASQGGDFRLSFGQSSTFSDFSQTIAIAGLLDPNTYTLRALASSSADAFSFNSAQNGQASFDVNLRLNSAAVPLPAAAWMFGLALSILLGFGSGRTRVTDCSGKEYYVLGFGSGRTRVTDCSGKEYYEKIACQGA